MDQEPDLSEQRSEEIRDWIGETRSDLTEKLEALEHKAKDTFADATRAVVETVQAVKGTVHETVASVKHALDLERQVDRHPWAMLGGSLAAGYVLGRLLAQRHPVTRPIRQRSVEASPPGSEGPRPLPASHAAGTAFRPVSPSMPEPRAPERGGFREFTEKFAPEIQQLKGLAIGTLMSLARDWIQQSVAPSLAPELGRVMDRVTSKLGGEPLPRPVN